MFGKEPIEDPEQLARFSTTQPLARFCFLWLITLGFYGWHWHYLNWRSFNYGKFSSVLLTIFDEISIYGLAKHIFRLANRQGITVRIDPIYMLISCLVGAYVAYKAPGFWLLLGLPLVLLPSLYLQRCLNMYWLKFRPERKQRSFFSGGFIAWSIFGVIFWSLFIIGTLDEMGVLQ
jgi:hypothetical protein